MPMWEDKREVVGEGGIEEEVLIETPNARVQTKKSKEI